MDTIPQIGKTYTSYYTNSDWCICIYKRVGFTPLQALSEIRTYLSTNDSAKCTYVGRLDPMAEGWMYILWSGDVSEKERLMAQDKVYEVEVLIGVTTDTGDVLGLIQEDKKDVIDISNIEEVAMGFVGPFTYPYPKYSSPNIKNTLKGVDLESKSQKGYIHSIRVISDKKVSARDLEILIDKKLSLIQMTGDFRLQEVKDGWKIFFKNNERAFRMLTVEVGCGSGTYMRSLAEQLGGLAFSIARIKLL